jgi:ectoine hydroxylase-related dioxygenase (phytanoyl-CoA dioxygenase family)
LLPLRWNDRIVRHLLNSERRAHLLSDCLGADDLRWISGYVSIKEPHSPPLWWHQDWWCWDHPVTYRHAAPQVAVLCYLTPTDERSGALRVLPGSHHRSLPIHALLPEPHDAGDLDAGHIAMNNHPEEVTLRLRAGDAVAIDYRLLHGTHENAGNARRDCILLSFTPSWRNLPEEVRGHLISHPALPAEDECQSELAREARLLPRFHGPRRDLVVNRRAPACFAMDDS